MGRRSRLFKGIAVGGFLAAAAGYVAGILTAPKSGRETRETIREAAGTGYSQAEKELKKLHTDLGKILDEAKNRSSKAGRKSQKDLSGLMDKASDAKDKVRQVLSAVHEGDASDKDLDKAIKDANRAIDHLRDYLKK